MIREETGNVNSLIGLFFAVDSMVLEMASRDFPTGIRTLPDSSRPGIEVGLSRRSDVRQK